MDIFGNLIDNLLGVIFGKWSARRKRSTEFKALRREILYTGIVNDYPIAPGARRMMRDVYLRVHPRPRLAGEGH
jgi:hypothetical protein